MASSYKTKLHKELDILKHETKVVLGQVSEQLGLYLGEIGLVLQTLVVSCCWDHLLSHKYQQHLLDFATDHRGIIIFFVCLPISYLMDWYRTIRNFFYARFVACPELHDKRVKHVQRQVRQWNQLSDRKKLPMCTGRNPTATMSVRTASFKRHCTPINCGDLTDILEIDPARQIVRTEPLVNMGYMTQYLMPKGYALAIQVEMEDLTIGGLAMGLGMETNSHRLGLLQENIVSYDIVLSTGELVHVTATNRYKDLFYALPWSHGTLGFCVALEVKIIPIKEYMHVTYIPCHCQEEYCTKIKALAEDTTTNPPSFLEATIYSKDKAMIMCGEFADATESDDMFTTINHINAWYKPWYYKYVQGLLENDDIHHDELIPLKQYYHRYTRSIFWEIEDLIPFSNQTWYRYLFGWLGAPKISLLKRTMTPAIRRSIVDKHVVQDIIIPISKMSDAVDLFHDLLEVYPLLVFHIAIFDHTVDSNNSSKNQNQYQGMMRRPENLLEGRNYQMFFDLGAYGVPGAVRRKEPWHGVETIRKIEHFTRQECKGYQCLYADTFQSREEFREMFDHTLYDIVRQKYNAIGAFPEIYDKIVPEVFVNEEYADQEED